MMEFFGRLFASDFMPHGHCYQWRPEILWLHVGADTVITLSYFTIPLALVYFIRHRDDLSFDAVFYLFAGFILFCGLTHSLEVYNVWNGAYRVEGVMKAATAFVSFATAVSVWQILPRALSIPSRADLEHLNRELQAEVERRRGAESELRELTTGLEEMVAERTRALELRSQLLDISHDAVFAWDSAGRVHFWNQGAERLYGYSEEEVARAGIDVHEKIAPGFSDLRSEIEGCVEGEGEWRGDIEQRHRSGRSLTVATCIQRIESDGMRLYLEVNRDITVRKEAEAQLARSNEELEQFAYVASHDLQEPLRKVVGFMEVVKERYADRLDEKGVQYVDHAIDGGIRMRDLIVDLLQYSRTGRARADARVSLSETLAEVEENLAPAIEASGAQIVSDGLPEVRVARVELMRVLQNLVSNALKYCEGAPRIEVAASREGSWVRVSVADNGIGIAPEYQERIFDVFRRLHGKDEYSGTGIGLAIVRRAVESWGGEVSVHSEAGRGSRFEFTVPAA